DHVLAVDLDLAVESSVHRVVARQVGVGLRVAQIVERDDLHLGGALALVERTQHVAADAPVAIDANSARHALKPRAIRVTVVRHYRPGTRNELTPRRLFPRRRSGRYRSPARRCRRSATRSAARPPPRRAAVSPRAAIPPRGSSRPER